MYPDDLDSEELLSNLKHVLILFQLKKLNINNGLHISLVTVLQILRTLPVLWFLAKDS